MGKYVIRLYDGQYLDLASVTPTSLESASRFWSKKEAEELAAPYGFRVVEVRKDEASGTYLVVEPLQEQHR